MRRADGNRLAMRVIGNVCENCPSVDLIEVRSRRIFRLMINGKRVLIRCGELKPDMRDFANGYLRFKVTGSIRDFDVVGFSL